MIHVPPAVRISFALVLIAISVLLFGNMIGLLPDKSRVAIETRKNVARSLAVQCALAAQDNNIANLRETMDAIVEVHPEVLSLGLHDVKGEKYLSQTNNHSSHWVAPVGSTSTSTHWQLPIQHGREEWGTLEISFKPQGLYNFLGLTINPIYLLLGFFGIISFIIFLIYMKTVLHHLDPTTVMPSRVRKMLDTLTEGVILMDENEKIILTNSSFANDLGHTAQSLMGVKVSELNWTDHKTKKPYELHPWIDAMSQKETQFNVQISLPTKSDNVQTYQANFSPILDDKGNCRGALATFNDVTELENKNIKLKYMLDELNKSQDEVKRQNEEMERQNDELEILATRDSLTGCLNRRAFFDKAEQYFEAVNTKGKTLACIMADIDLFKAVNDKYGHSVGDQVIQYFANSLISVLKGDNLICRYGGEEFCILLPNYTLTDADMIAELLREKVFLLSSTAVPDIPTISVAGSFGVSELCCGADNVEKLIEQADLALYRAKKEGRNRVVCFKNSRTNEPEAVVENLMAS